MSYPPPLSEWRETVSRAFPALSRPQATVLALWSYGMVMAKSCGITLVCATLALQLGTSEANLVQRLREWCYATKNKRGAKRQELEVSTCFAPLLRWILEWWPMMPHDVKSKRCEFLREFSFLKIFVKRTKLS